MSHDKREIPMTTRHQELVLDGRKTTTLRGQRFEPGVYAMVDKRGDCQGCVEVVSIDPEQVEWPKLSLVQQQALAITEGYPAVEGLVKELQRLRHYHFLGGKRGLWLHRLRPANFPDTIESLMTSGMAE